MGKRVSINRGHTSEMRRQPLSQPLAYSQTVASDSPWWAVLLMCVALAAVTLVVYWQTTHFELTNVDDPDYIINNTHVRGGLTWDNFRWAFKIGNAANWHPLTWLTHMFDCQFWGMLPGELKGTGGHHLTNFTLHIASVLLLFGLLNRLTGKFWASSLVAVVFAIHPLHAESVAWVAERKDVLSAFFMMLTLWAYAGYARDASPTKYVLTAFVFGLGLLSKQMLVTVPFLLLLLDYWPLNRWSRSRGMGPLLLEKIPLIGLALIAGILLLISQKQGGAIATTERVPALTRVTNAIVTYVVYIVDLFWPKNLAHYYPHEGVHWTWWQIICSAAVLFAITLLVIRLGSKRPYLFVGWCWYIVTLLPVIGILQVGAQARADRYTYIPSIGICIMIAFGLADVFATLFRTVTNPVFAFTAAVLTAAMIPPAHEQVSYWHDSEKLYRHTLAVTKNNWFVFNGMGSVLNGEAELLRGQHKYAEAKAKNEEAVKQLNAALKITQGGEEGAGAGSLSRRAYTWEIAADIFRENPVLGVGVGNWDVARYLKDPTQSIGAPHSSYFLALCEGGIFCLSAFLILLWRCWRNIRFAESYVDDPMFAIPELSELRWIIKSTKTDLFVLIFFSAFADLWQLVIVFWLVSIGIVLRRMFEQATLAQFLEHPVLDSMDLV